MRTLSLCLAALAIAVQSAPVLAHPEDESGMWRRPSTSDLATEAVGRLVEAKKLPASWVDAKITGFDLRTKNGADQYVVVFENARIKPAAKRKLYVLMTTSGQFISANYK